MLDLLRVCCYTEYINTIFNSQFSMHKFSNIWKFGHWKLFRNWKLKIRNYLKVCE